MFLLKKLFQMRGKVAESRSKWDDVEKPFLDHLEDLRVMLVKAALTLVITMVVCFAFDKELLEVVRYPVKLAGLESLDGSRLPPSIQQSDWGKIKDLSRAAVTLDPAARTAFEARIPEGLRDSVRATIYFRAALTLPKDQRDGFIREACPPGPALDLATYLVTNNPNAHLDDSGQLLRMTALGPSETFTLSLKLAFISGIIISFPLLLWYLAEFIMPGLTPAERKMVLPSVLLGFALFVTGVVFAYFYVAPQALRFFYDYSMRLGVISDWRIGYFVSFVTQFTLIFGLCFELPVVVMALVKLNILGYEMMSRTRSHAVVGIFIVAAIITPTTDAFCLFLLAGPMICLYELCIWLAWLIERKARQREIAEEAEWQQRKIVPAVVATDVVLPEDGPTAYDPLPEDPVVRPVEGAVPTQNPLDLPPDWGDTSDPYNVDAPPPSLPEDQPEKWLEDMIEEKDRDDDASEPTPPQERPPDKDSPPT